MNWFMFNLDEKCNSSNESLEWCHSFRDFDEYEVFLIKKIEDAIWENAKLVNKIKTFKQYINKYPNGKYVEQAKEKIEDIRWKNAQSKNTIESYQGYLKKHSDGKYAQEAKDKIEKITQENTEKSYWDKAKLLNSINSYRDYLNRYPNGKYANQAKKKIKELEEDAEDSAWNSAQSTNTIESYNEYLDKYPYPSGRYSIEANQIKNDMEMWENIKDSQEILPYEHYLKKYPNAINSIIAKKRIKEIQFWEKIKQQNTIKSYREYISKYDKNGLFYNKALYLIEKINAVEFRVNNFSLFEDTPFVFHIYIYFLKIFSYVKKCKLQYLEGGLWGNIDTYLIVYDTFIEFSSRSKDDKNGVGFSTEIDFKYIKNIKKIDCSFFLPSLALYDDKNDVLYISKTKHYDILLKRWSKYKKSKL